MVSVVSVHLNYLVKQTDRQMAANPHTKLTYLGSESASRLLPSHCHLLLLLSPKVDNLFLSFLSSCKTRRLSSSKCAWSMFKAVYQSGCHGKCNCKW